jgi:hypothetical protein
LGSSSRDLGVLPNGPRISCGESRGCTQIDVP